jgi:hypothetical protein
MMPGHGIDKLGGDTNPVIDPAAVFFDIGTEDRGKPTLDLGKILRDGAIGGGAPGNRSL